VASNCYIQPLIPRVATDLGVPRSRGGLLVTVSQLGYIVGLIALVSLDGRCAPAPRASSLAD